MTLRASVPLVALAWAVVLACPAQPTPRPATLSLKAPPQVGADGVALRLAVRADEPGTLDLWLNGRLVESWRLPAQEPPAEYPVPADQFAPGAVNVAALRFTPDAGKLREAEVTVYHPGPRRPGRLFAVVVGVGDYPALKAGGVALPDLDYARRDARKVKEYLLGQRAAGTHAAVEVVHLTDKEATRERLVRELDRLAKLRLPGNDRVLFYFSGHGARGGAKPDPAEPRVALVTSDARPDDLLASGLSNADLYARLAAIGGHKLVLLDACHAGGFVLGRADLPADLRRLVPPQGAGLAVLAGCRLEQESLEAHPEAQGLFTHALLATLTTPATDAGRNGVLTLEEVFAGVATRMAAAARPGVPAQQPEPYLRTLEKSLPWFAAAR